MNNYEDWLRDGQHVEARYASGPGIHGHGWIYAYSDHPTVHIVQSDGTDLTWNAHLCVAVGEASDEARRAALARRDLPAAGLAHLVDEVVYWRKRAERLEGQVRQIAQIDPALPPEPPVGTAYLKGLSEKAWERREDGWHCSRPDDQCTNCPCDWDEAWNFGVRNGDLARRLP